MAWYTLNQHYEGDIEAFEKSAIASSKFTGDRRNCTISPSFSHIFGGGYSASYYSDKWAEVLVQMPLHFLGKRIYDKETAKVSGLYPF
jgi:peptidyl-dipeptidase Dcp